MYAENRKRNNLSWKTFLHSYLDRPDQLVMFSKNYSPECVICKRSLRRLDCITEDNFISVDIEKRSDVIVIENHLMYLTKNTRRQVPLFFLTGRYIGGYDDIIRREMDGSLPEFIFRLLNPDERKSKHPTLLGVRIGHDNQLCQRFNIQINTKWSEDTEQTSNAEGENQKPVRISDSDRYIISDTDYLKESFETQINPDAPIKGDPTCIAGAIAEFTGVVTTPLDDFLDSPYIPSVPGLSGRDELEKIRRKYRSIAEKAKRAGTEEKSSIFYEDWLQQTQVNEEIARMRSPSGTSTNLKAEPRLERSTSNFTSISARSDRETVLPSAFAFPRKRSF